MTIRRTAIVMCVLGLFLAGAPLLLLGNNEAILVFRTYESPDYLWINRTERNFAEVKIGFISYLAVATEDGTISIWRYRRRPPSRVGNIVTRVGPQNISFPGRPIVLLIAVILGYLLAHPHLVRYQRRKRGLCVKCGYDLTGNKSGTCPECGYRSIRVYLANTTDGI